MTTELEDQYDKIYRYCCLRVSNPQLAEDLTQETFLKYFSQNTYLSRGKHMAIFAKLFAGLSLSVVVTVLFSLGGTVALMPFAYRAFQKHQVG
ncbi:MAG: hypothetical protein RR185_02265 [Angelakisella sp.]